MFFNTPSACMYVHLASAWTVTRILVIFSIQESIRHWLVYGEYEHSNSTSWGRSSKSQHIPWPARSPDLAPCDFFLWGHLKAEVYKHRPHTLDELKTAIPPDMTARMMNNFRKRLDACIRSQGRHMDDIVFHK
jgi:hypothetical protein